MHVMERQKFGAPTQLPLLIVFISPMASRIFLLLIVREKQIELAHFLAWRRYDSKICEEWLDEMPSFLLPHVIFDETHFQIE